MAPRCGDGGGAAYFHNVRPIIGFGLPAGGIVRGLSYVALGGYASVKAQLEALLKARAPFGGLDVPARAVTTHYGAGSLTVAGWVLDTAYLTGFDPDGASVTEQIFVQQ